MTHQQSAPWDLDFASLKNDIHFAPKKMSNYPADTDLFPQGDVHVVHLEVGPTASQGHLCCGIPTSPSGGEDRSQWSSIDGNFHEINHPSGKIPPFMETPMFYTQLIGTLGVIRQNLYTWWICLVCLAQIITETTLQFAKSATRHFT